MTSLREIPMPGDVYQHHSGTMYTVITTANLDATRPGWAPQVVYEDPQERRWCRPLERFLAACERVPE